VRRAAAVGLALCAALGAGCGAKPAAHAPPSESLPRPVTPAFTPGRPEPLGSTRFLARWAPVVRAATARARPDAHAPAVARIDTRTPEDTANIVMVLGHRTDRSGRLWVRAGLAILPNGRTGWLPRGALGGYGTVETQLVIDLERLTATLLRSGRPVFRAPIGVGRPEWATPRGRFYIRNRLTRYAGPTYGPVAFGTSARSPHFTDWPGGGFIGIHGTDHPELVPGRISHGCIRLRNPDILRLDRLMPVGTPVTIH
jgi:lipoprotein-anchoring transpeptidase ErfK/SrfK